MFNQLPRRFDDFMTVDWQQRVLYSPSWSSNFPSALLRPRLYVQHFSPGVEGSLVHPSSPGRANASYISLQNLANRLHKKQKVGSAGTVSLFSATTSPHVNGALLTSYSPIEFFNPVIPTQGFAQSRYPDPAPHLPRILSIPKPSLTLL